jgi:plastocyanin
MLAENRIITSYIALTKTERSLFVKKTVLIFCTLICCLSTLIGISGADPYEVKGDINGDKRISLEEAVYALRVAAGIQIGQPGNKSETEPNDIIGEANQIGIGYSNPIINATISSKDDVDCYKFNANSNSTYVMETYDILANSSNQATGIYLYDANGIELANDRYGQNGTNNVNACIAHTFSVTGTYYILVRKDYSASSWTGYYSLRILPKHDEQGSGWNSENDYEPNDKLALANHIETGLDKAQTHQLDPKSSNYVNSGSDRDWYSFNAESGRSYVIETFDIVANASNNATGLYLYDASGIELANDRYGQNGTNNANARIIHTFSRSGVYYILVLDDYSTDWAGTYSLRILPKHDEPGAKWNTENDYEPNDELVLANYIEVGREQTHQLNPKSPDYVNSGSDHDWYYFEAEANGTYVIETFDTQSDNATGIYLYDSNGIELANDRYGQNGTNNANARITHTFSRSGSYYILVLKDYSVGWVGIYSLRVNKQ